MSTFVQYDENKLAHQEPVQAISEWQQWNDVTGAESIWYEMDILHCEEKERLRVERENTRTIYSRQMRKL